MRLTELTLENLDAAAPMWRALYDHHVAITPRVAEVISVRTSDESWASRRASYERWLSEPGGFGLLAEVGGTPVGYAVARLAQDEGASWDLGVHGELETLSVLPGHRGGRIGTALMAEVRRRLTAAGARTMTIHVISTNTDALRLYEREGAVPFYNVLVAPLDGGHTPRDGD